MAFKMTKSLVSFVATTTLLIVMPFATWAGEKEFRSFFEEMEGTWRGKGARQALQADGKMQTVPYTVEFDHRNGSKNEWRTDAEFRTDSGTYTYGNVHYRLNGDALYISTVSPIDPAEILDNTDTKLTWKSYRTDWILRRTYITTTTLERVTPRQLKFSETITLNGVLLQSEAAELKLR